VFFIKSEEEIALCPNCGGLLEYHSSRVVRKLTNKTGMKQAYNIRVLKCTNKSCPTTYHRELPDIIIPYKRYDTESIEEVIAQNDSEVTVAADESTIRRWRKWFRQSATQIIMALVSVCIVIGDKAGPSSLIFQNTNKPVETVKKIVKRKVKWLNEAVRILVNSSKWEFNRSAFLSG